MPVEYMAMEMIKDINRFDFQSMCQLGRHILHQANEYKANDTT